MDTNIVIHRNGNKVKSKEENKTDDKAEEQGNTIARL